ncbi:hypothetical protein GPOL_174p00340 (plasmid) [Gordonia polyisoprenivorans VH2]|uniref:Uncharacterized protein n=1 Tax=Gordonia polyisoprenivorans (strain DSM 44266 / VH2) TaxID=1112204 RepID=H6N510_GORPV|nr:hypothetical protein [Gordonia polyisoprenivorans]AFA76055.1 hypothetical protein GPOL_174p00340 [Gordonia polyisoprenivorans VH2]
MAGPQNKQAWLRDRATRLSGRMAQRGMTLSVDAAETFLARQHAEAVEHLGITERSARVYLDDAALDELADRLIADFAAEEPAADLTTLPRTAQASADVYGRFLAALGETILFYQRYPHLGVDDRCDRVCEIAALISTAGILQAESTGAVVTAPPALLHRIARTLDTAAALTDNTALATAFTRDSTTARATANTTPPPPRLHSVD